MLKTTISNLKSPLINQEELVRLKAASEAMNKENIELKAQVAVLEMKC